MSYAPNTICPSLYRVLSQYVEARDRLRKDIDAVIRLSNTYDDFIRLVKQKGYEIKGDS